MKEELHQLYRERRLCEERIETLKRDIKILKKWLWDRWRIVT